MEGLSRTPPAPYIHTHITDGSKKPMSNRVKSYLLRLQSSHHHLIYVFTHLFSWFLNSKGACEKHFVMTTSDTNTHFNRIKEEGGSGRPPPPPSPIDILYIILKGILWRFRFKFKFFKNILISRLYEQFSRNDSPNVSRMGVRKNFKL